MKYYIFDREKDSLFRDDDGVLICFKSDTEVWSFLKNDCQFTTEWVLGNFFMMKGCKILEHE
jgi:hypothetical protein